MTSRAVLARHRAEAQRSAHFSSIARAVSDNAGGVGRQAAVIAAASGLVLTGGVSATAAQAPTEREAVTSTLEIQSAPAVVEASADAEVSFNRTPVKAVAKPAVIEETVTEAPAVAEEPAAVEAPVEVVEEVAAVQEVAFAAETVVEATVSPAATQEAPAADTPSESSGVAATIAAAAQAQLGVTQDCTRLVSNALAAAGINFHGWPAGYLSLGRTVSTGEAIPGDLIYYSDGGAGVAHIAVYIGNGQAVHGGFNGNQTVIESAFLGSGPVFIRVGG